MVPLLFLWDSMVFIVVVGLGFGALRLATERTITHRLDSSTIIQAIVKIAILGESLHFFGSAIFAFPAPQSQHQADVSALQSRAKISHVGQILPVQLGALPFGEFWIFSLSFGSFIQIQVPFPAPDRPRSIHRFASLPSEGLDPNEIGRRRGYGPIVRL